MTRESDIVDPMQDRINAAMRLARTVADKDDPRFVRTVHAVLNAVDELEAGGTPAAEPARAAASRGAPALPAVGRASLRRGIGRPRATQPTLDEQVAPALEGDGIAADSVFSDPAFLANAQWLLANRRRIVGGVATGAFPDCVAVGSQSRWCCTGTLIAPNLVVTAAHCLGDCDSRAFVGLDVEKPDQGRTIKVKDRVVHPSYSERDPHGDIAVLILQERVEDVTPRRVAPMQAVGGQRSVRVVGYGHTDSHGTVGYGTRRLVDVPLATNDPRFGGDPETEFVAGARFLDRDSCSGDSGGPAYAFRGGRWLLIGATSRSTASSLRVCGDGGIYTLVPAYEEWLTTFASRARPKRPASRAHKL